VHRVENKEVEIDFKRSPSEIRKRSEYLWVYNVLHCSDSDAFPVPVAPVCIDPRDDSAEQSVRDPNPPTSGTSFYVMSLTRRIPTADAIGQMLPDNFAPWWGSAMDADSRLQRFKRQKFGVTSDYSNPFVYRADPFPELGAIDALAVDIVTGDVYISTPGLDGWIDVQRNKNNKLQPREHWVQAGFKMPGQHGLAIDEYGNLYSDNKASDDAFGGRIFQFSQPDGAREFVGSINYFSQLLMFANPVASGPMCFGWKTLFVWEDMSRDAREVDVLATYDPYRRVGQPYVNLTDTPGGPAIDMEYDGGLYILQLNQISEIIRPIDPNSGNYYSVVFAITIEEKK
jgi:hypothetical protein